MSGETTDAWKRREEDVANLASRIEVGDHTVLDGSDPTQTRILGQGIREPLPDKIGIILAADIQARRLIVNLEPLLAERDRLLAENNRLQSDLHDPASRARRLHDEVATLQHELDKADRKGNEWFRSYERAKERAEMWKRIALSLGAIENEYGRVLIPNDEGLGRTNRWWWPW